MVLVVWCLVWFFRYLLRRIRVIIMVEVLKQRCGMWLGGVVSQRQMLRLQLVLVLRVISRFMLLVLVFIVCQVEIQKCVLMMNCIGVVRRNCVYGGSIQCRLVYFISIGSISGNVSNSVVIIYQCLWCRWCLVLFWCGCFVLSRWVLQLVCFIVCSKVWLFMVLSSLRWVCLLVRLMLILCMLGIFFSVCLIWLM